MLLRRRTEPARALDGHGQAGRLDLRDAPLARPAPGAERVGVRVVRVVGDLRAAAVGRAGVVADHLLDLLAARPGATRRLPPLRPGVLWIALPLERAGLVPERQARER